MIRQGIHQDKKVWVETIMDELRRNRCLCLQCDNLADCDVAEAMYAICKDNDLVIATTRCRMFDNGHKNPSQLDEGDTSDES